MNNSCYIMLKKLTQDSRSEKLDATVPIFYRIIYLGPKTKRISRSLLVVEVFLLDLYH